MYLELPCRDGKRRSINVYAIRYIEDSDTGNEDECLIVWGSGASDRAGIAMKRKALVTCIDEVLVKLQKMADRAEIWPQEVKTQTKKKKKGSRK